MSMLGPVAFETSGPVQVSRDGMLHKKNSQQGPGHSFSQVCIDSSEDTAFSGITFDVASGGFPQLELGLTQACREEGQMDFSVVLDGSVSGVSALLFQVSGALVGSIPCTGNETVTIRLDGLGEYIEFLVNEELLYTSARKAILPLACKVVNNTCVENLWLPARNLFWSKSSFTKVLTLRVVDVREHGVATISCTNLAGEELARIDAMAGHSVAYLKEVLGNHTGVHARQVRLVSDGKLLDDMDSLIMPAGDWKHPMAGADM